MGGISRYTDPPLSKSKLKRGGTRCACGNEKDRRSERCWDCKDNPQKGLGAGLDAQYLTLWRCGMTQARIAVLEGVTKQRVSQRIQRALRSQHGADVSGLDVESDHIN